MEVEEGLPGCGSSSNRRLPLRSLPAQATRLAAAARESNEATSTNTDHVRGLRKPPRPAAPVARCNCTPSSHRCVPPLRRDGARISGPIAARCPKADRGVASSGYNKTAHPYTHLSRLPSRRSHQQRCVHRFVRRPESVIAAIPLTPVGTCQRVASALCSPPAPDIPLCTGPCLPPDQLGRPAWFAVPGAAGQRRSPARSPRTSTAQLWPLPRTRAATALHSWYDESFLFCPFLHRTIHSLFRLGRLPIAPPAAPASSRPLQSRCVPCSSLALVRACPELETRAAGGPAASWAGEHARVKGSIGGGSASSPSSCCCCQSLL